MGEFCARKHYVILLGNILCMSHSYLAVLSFATRESDIDEVLRMSRVYLATTCVSGNLEVQRLFPDLHRILLLLNTELRKHVAPVVINLWELLLVIAPMSLPPPYHVISKKILMNNNVNETSEARRYDRTCLFLNAVERKNKINHC